MHILSRLKLVKTFVLDIDGVLTNGSLIIDKGNGWVRKMNIKDGYALQLAVKCGFEVLVMSGSNSQQVTERLNRLGVKEVFVNVKDKEKLLKELVLAKGLALNEILYMGDDIPDYSCMKLAGIAACPSDAVAEIKAVASYISPLAGGDGCVRDVIEKVLKLNGKWPLDSGIPST